MTPLRALLVTGLVLLGLVGTAGLMSLDSEGGCFYHWEFQELDTRSAARPLSVWPPGRTCRLVAAGGAVLAERPRPGFERYLVLLALELALLVALLRARRPAPAALRAAASATLGLLAWGVASLWLDAVLGAMLAITCVLLSICAIAMWRAIRGGALRADAGLAPLAPLTGLFVSAAFGDPLAQLITVALLTGAALACGWVMRRLRRRPTGAA